MRKPLPGALIAILLVFLPCCGALKIDEPESTDDDIYKCATYTGMHVDTLHWIKQNFSEYKDCPADGLYTLSRRTFEFIISVEVKNSWIVEVRCISIAILTVSLGSGHRTYSEWNYSTHLWSQYEPVRYYSDGIVRSQWSVERHSLINLYYDCLASRLGVNVQVARESAFETLSLYHGARNLTLIITHNVRQTKESFSVYYQRSCLKQEVQRS